MVHVCAICGAEHTIHFDRGAQKTKTGPFALGAGDTLVVEVDGGPPVTVTFTAGDFPDFGNVTSGQLAAKLNAALTGMTASDDSGGVLIESASTGPGSRVEIAGGSARAALGFPTDGRLDPCPSRPVLGISLGAMKDKNVIALRRCNDCGSNECLIRTFDAAPPELDGSFFKEHRKSVNALAEHFKGRGWSHADVAADHAAERAAPLDLDAGFPARASAPPAFVRPNAPPPRGAIATEG
jgi:hypothetical protein